MGGKTLISTVFEGQVVPIAAHKLGPDKIILLVDDPIHDKRKKAVETLKQKYDGVLKVETAVTSVYDIAQIAKDVAALIDKEFSEGNTVVLHVSESRKTHCMGAMFGAYVRKDKVAGIYYIEEETDNLLKLPIINIKLNGTKAKLLREIDEGNKKAKDLAAKLGIHLSMVYAHVKDLIKDDLLTEDWKLTDAGKLRII